MQIQWQTVTNRFSWSESHLQRGVRLPCNQPTPPSLMILPFKLPDLPLNGSQTETASRKTVHFLKSEVVDS